MKGDLLIYAVFSWRMDKASKGYKWYQTMNKGLIYRNYWSFKKKKKKYALYKTQMLACSVSFSTYVTSRMRIAEQVSICVYKAYTFFFFLNDQSFR